MKKLLLIPIIFILSLINVNSFQLASGNIDSIFISPLTEDTFVVTWCDETIDEILYTIYDSRGSQLLQNITITGAAGGCANEGDSIDISSFNSTHFVIGLASTTGSEARFQVFKNDGSNVTNPITVDSNMGGGNTIAVSTLNETDFVFSWVDDGAADQRIRYQHFSVDGSSVSAVITVSDADISTVRDTSIGTFNQSAIVVAHQEKAGGQRALMFDTYLNDVLVSNEVTVDLNMGSHSEFDVAVLNETTFVLAWIDSTDVSYGIFNFDGTISLAQTVVDTVTASVDNIQVAKINDTVFGLVWSDESENGTFIFVGDSSGATVTAKTEIFDNDGDGIAIASAQNGINANNIELCLDGLILAGEDNQNEIFLWTANSTTLAGFGFDGFCVSTLNQTNLNVFQSKNPVEILETFTLFANYTNSTDDSPVLNAACFANSSIVGGGQAGFGRGILGIGGLSTLNNAVHTQINDIFNNNTLRVDIDNIPLGKASYAVNFRFHAHNQTPLDDLRVFATCHNNLTFSNFTLIGQVNTTEAVISTSTQNDTIWGFKNVVLFGESVATSNCSIVFESLNTTPDKHWMIADTTTNLNLNNSFTSTDFGETYVLRTNADTRSPFVDAGFGLDVPSETTMDFNSSSGLYFLPNIRHGRPFDFEDRVFCSADNFENATSFVVTNVQDNVPPIVQINVIDPLLAILNISNVTIQWSVNDPELLTNFINVSFPNGTLLIQTDEKPLILTTNELTVVGNYTVVAFANDTGGLFTLTNGSFQVAEIDVTPPVITLIAPENNSRNNSVPLNITFTVTDNFPNNILCIFQNTTVIFDAGTFTQAVTSTVTLAKGEIALDQNFPDLSLTCFDNTIPNNNSAVLNLNYTLDTVPPIIFPISPENLAIFNNEIITSINIKGNCTDVPVFRLNITIENSSDRIASFENRNPINNFIVIDEQLDISILGAGNYTVNFTCADPHTKRIIGNYNIRKNDSDAGIEFTATDGDTFKIRYLNDSLGIIDYGSSKSVLGDRYSFFYETGVARTRTTRTFTFEILSRKPVYHLSDSKFNGHFITGNHWIDFQLPDPDAVYTISTNPDGNFEVAITTELTRLDFDSVGDLNIASVVTSFEVFSIEQIVNFLQVNECKNDTGSVLLLGLFFLIALSLIGLAFATRVGFIGVFGGLMLWVDSWYIAPCVRILALLLTLLAMLFIFYFIFRGFFPSLIRGGKD